MVLLDLARIPARAVLKAAQVVSGRGPSVPVTAPLNTDRLSIAVPGVQRPDAAEYRHQLCAAVERVSGVSWAVVNARCSAW